MKFYKGVRFKLAALYACITAITLACFSVYQYYSLWGEMMDNLDTRIQDEIMDFQREYILNQVTIDSYAKLMAAQNAKVPLQPAVFAQFADTEGRILAYSDKSHASSPLISQEVFDAAVSGEEDVSETVTGRYEWPIRVHAARLKTTDGRYVILQLGVSIRRLVRTTRGFASNLAVASVALVFLSLFIGWAMAKRSLRPVHNIIATTQAITAERLQERLQPVGSGDEIDELIHTLNSMIGRLESAFKQITQFTADVSHELRTPLAVMRGEIEVALEYGKTVEDLRNVLISSLEELDRLSVIANDLLLLARADAHMGIERFEEVDLQHVLLEVASDATILAQSRGVALLADSIPPAVLLGNRDALRRLFMNLLDNAVKYTPSGGEVSLSCEVRDGSARALVRDTGIGIAPEDLPRIFDRFYKASRSRMAKDDKGAGLGLSISKALAEQHGGNISCQSAPNRGTTFTVVLPLLDSTRASAPCA